METIVREKTETITRKKVIYIAIDGTEFEDKDECEKYEKTAEAVLRVRINDCVIKSRWHSVMDDNEEHSYDTLVPTKSEHIEAINQMWWLFGGRGDKTVPLLTADDMNKPLLMGYRFDEDNWYDWVWFYKLDELINKATEDKFQITEKKEGWSSYEKA